VVSDYKFLFLIWDAPKIVYLFLPAGRTVDTILEELLPYLDQNDVVMDGGNPIYLHSIEREKRLWSQSKYIFLTWYKW